MSSIPESTTTDDSRSRRHDTGFHETFCGNRNTSLPHPDANLSPDACITQDDFDSSSHVRRHKRSLLARHRRTISHGTISQDASNRWLTPPIIEVDSEATPIDGSNNDYIKVLRGPMIRQTSKDCADSFGVHSDASAEDITASSPISESHHSSSAGSPSNGGFHHQDYHDEHRDQKKSGSVFRMFTRR